MKNQAKSRRFSPVSAVVSVQTRVERHLRMTEAAAVLGVSRATVYRMLPQIRHSRIAAGGLTREIVLIPESALAEFLAAHERKAVTA